MLEDFNKKEYAVPRGIPLQHSHKYLEVINMGWAKYLDIINSCGKYIMFPQFYELIGLFEGNGRTLSSNEIIGNKVLSRLEELGFVGSEYAGKIKYAYLKLPGMAVGSGVYSNKKKIVRSAALKNDKFKTTILNVECFLRTHMLFSSETMVEQLKKITKDILNKIYQSGNQYGYAVPQIEQILLMNDYLEIYDYLKEHPEYRYKLDIIRSLWRDVGMLYRNLVLAKQTVSSVPDFLEYYTLSNGRIILHYVPRILIFDVGFTQRYYKDKLNKLFHAFFNVEGNELREVQKTFIASKGGSLGTKTEHRIGYSLFVFGIDKELLELKKKILSEEIGSVINSPMINSPETLFLDINKYFHHPNSSNNKKRDEYNQKIEDTVLFKLGSIREVPGDRAGKVKKGLNIVDLLNS